MSDGKINAQLLTLTGPWFISRLEVDVPGEAEQVYIDHRHVFRVVAKARRLRIA